MAKKSKLDFNKRISFILVKLIIGVVFILGYYYLKNNYSFEILKEHEYIVYIACILIYAFFSILLVSIFSINYSLITIIIGSDFALKVLNQYLLLNEYLILFSYYIILIFFAYWLLNTSTFKSNSIVFIVLIWFQFILFREFIFYLKEYELLLYAFLNILMFIVISQKSTKNNFNKRYKNVDENLY